MIRLVDAHLRHVWARRAMCLLLSSCILPVSSMASAQTLPRQVIPPTREEVTRPETQPLRNRAPQLEVEGGVERAPCALDSPEFASIRFTVRGAQFEGLKGLSPSDLDSSFASLVGTEQPISVVCDIRDRAATILRQAGYIASVEVPEQRIGDGVLPHRAMPLAGQRIAPPLQADFAGRRVGHALAHRRDFRAEGIERLYRRACRGRTRWRPGPGWTGGCTSSTSRRTAPRPSGC